jgi:hypothetical protein
MRTKQRGEERERKNEGRIEVIVKTNYIHEK